MIYNKINYIVKYPNNFEKDKKYPVVVFLHGAGSRGSNIKLIENNPFFKAENCLWDNAIVFAPQCYTGSWFDIFEQLNDFVHFAFGNENADKDRCSLIGASMGAYAVWQLAMTQPDIYSAIIPICGGGMYWNGVVLKHMNIWAFHGKEDKVVFCEESVKMVDSVNQNGGHAKITLFDNVEHNSWDLVYNDDKVMKWLLSCDRTKGANEQFDATSSVLFG